MNSHQLQGGLRNLSPQTPHLASILSFSLEIMTREIKNGIQTGALAIQGTVTASNGPRSSSHFPKDATFSTANPQPAPPSFSFLSYRFLLGDNLLVSHFFNW